MLTWTFTCRSCVDVGSTSTSKLTVHLHSCQCSQCLDVLVTSINQLSLRFPGPTKRRKPREALSRPPPPPRRSPLTAISSYACRPRQPSSHPALTPRTRPAPRVAPRRRSAISPATNNRQRVFVAPRVAPRPYVPLIPPGSREVIGKQACSIRS